MNLQKSDARVLELHGRQRMRSQKMSKELFAAQLPVLDVAQGNLASAAIMAMLLQSSLEDLTDGSEVLGLPPVEPGAARYQLLLIQSGWIPSRQERFSVMELPVSHPDWEEAIKRVRNAAPIQEPRDCMLHLADSPDTSMIPESDRPTNWAGGKIRQCLP